ncbi:MAG: hypothetical protein ACRD0K_04205 [Egibacteraceae bacterium]
MSDTVAEREGLASGEAGLGEPGGQRSAVALPGLYRAVWRWHFYAAAFVIPVLVMLAVTGMIHLFRP